MKRTAYALIVSAFLALTGAAGAAQITVDEDPGGLTMTQKLWMERLNGAKISIRFIGDCRSACTLGLGVANSCVEPTATFGFHLFAYDFSGKTFDLGLTQAWYRRWVPKLLPIIEEMKLTATIKFKSAAELVEAGVVPWCEKE